MVNESYGVAEKAEGMARKAHEGQYRKDGKTPYITHPEAVVGLLKGVGVKDADILGAAWLHDTMEDCGLTQEYLEKEANPNVARIVYEMTRNVDRDAYKERIKNADFAVQMVKLADTVHNTSDLKGATHLPEKTIRRKVEDCQALYLGIAEKICPAFHAMLLEHLEPWL